MTSDFLNSKITEAILEEITDCSIIRTYFLIDFWKLWVNSRYQIRKGHYLVRPLFTVFSHILSNLYFVLWLVMGSGSKSRVWVEFGYCFSGSGLYLWVRQVRVILVGFGLGFRVLKYGIFDPLGNFYCIFMQ